MATPIHPTLRPLTIGQLLDRAIRLYRRNFILFTTIVAVMMVPLTLAQMVLQVLTLPGRIEANARLFTTASANPLETFITSMNAAGGGPSAWIIALLTFVLIQGVATVTLVGAVSTQYLNANNDLSVMQAFRNNGGRWWTLVWTLIITFFMSAGIVLFWFIPFIGWFTGLGAAFFFAAVVLQLLAPVIVIERKRGGHAIRRAWDLARRRFWWLLLFMFILTIFAQLVVTGPSVLATLGLTALLDGSGFADDFATYTTIQIIVQSFVGLLTTIIYLPVQLAATTLVYYDLRIRNEGFDLALQAASASAEAGTLDVEQVAAQAPPAGRSGLVTWSEMGYFASLSVGAFVLLVGFWILIFLLAAGATLLTTPGF